MTWFYLILAGLFEVVWSSTMKLSEGFTQISWTMLTVIGMIASFGFLALKFETFTVKFSLSDLDWCRCCWINNCRSIFIWRQSVNTYLVIYNSVSDRNYWN